MLFKLSTKRRKRTRMRFLPARQSQSEKMMFGMNAINLLINNIAHCFRFRRWQAGL